MASLSDIDLKFSGFISDVYSDNPAKFREVSMPRSRISNIVFFEILVCNLQTGQVMSTTFFDFVPPYEYQHLVRNSSSHLLQFLRSQGGWNSPPPPDAIKLLEMTDGSKLINYAE